MPDHSASRFTRRRGHGGYDTDDDRVNSGVAARLRG
jgi:hypothetical protein